MFKKNNLKNILIKGSEGIIKPFSYSKNSVNLRFQLNIENKKELNDFKDCLEAAIEDINKYIEKL